MAVGELVVASVVDHRVWSAEGERGAPGIYLAGVPGRAFPFTMYRAWKIGTGMVSEEVRFYGPSGRMAYRWGPHARHMLGSMDLTIETDLVEDGRFEETGMHLASFIVDGDVVAELEVPVYLQQAPAKLAKEVEDGLKKSDVIWIASGRGASKRRLPQRATGSRPKISTGISASGPGFSPLPRLTRPAAWSCRRGRGPMRLKKKSGMC